MVNDENEAVKTYRYLLDNEEKRERIGVLARECVLKEYTFRHRACQLIDIVRGING